MTRDEIERLAARWMALWTPEGLDDFDAVHAPHFVDHSSGDRGRDRAAFKAGLAALYGAFPDFRAAIERLAIDEKESRAAIAWSASGTHRGRFMDVAPTGFVVRFAGVELIECAYDQVTARWGEWDAPGIAAQLRAGE
jgi:predicted ester cyclase